MREINKAKKAAELTPKDFAKAIGNNKIEALTHMLRSDLYAYRIKKYLYDEGKISPNGFLFNDNIYNLPLGKKDAKGEILIDSGIMAIFDRFMFSDKLAEKGDALTAYIVDHDDALYEVLMQNVSKEKKISEDEYIQVFNEAYKRVSTIILDAQINILLDSDTKLASALKQREDEKNEKSN
jgi:hypothetical protein